MVQKTQMHNRDPSHHLQLTTVANTESGDGTTTWRDNASVQYRNCIFIGKGDKLVRADGEDGDGTGYGHNGL